MVVGSSTGRLVFSETKLYLCSRRVVHHCIGRCFMVNQFTKKNKPGFRICSRCNTEKPLSLEYFLAGHPKNGGFSYYCIPCMRSYQRSPERRARAKVRKSCPEMLAKHLAAKHERNVRDGAQSSLKYRSRWTSEEESFLKENDGKMTCLEIGKILGRSMIAVEHKRNRMCMTSVRWTPANEGDDP